MIVIMTQTIMPFVIAFIAGLGTGLIIALLMAFTINLYKTKHEPRKIGPQDIYDNY